MLQTAILVMYTSPMKLLVALCITFAIVLTLAAFLYIQENTVHEGADDLIKVEGIYFGDKRLYPGDEFYFEPEDSCVGDIKAKLIGTTKGTAQIQILEEQQPNGQYNKPSAKGSKIDTLENGKCLTPTQRCMDAVSFYCFDIKYTTIPHTYTFTIKTEGIGPKPPIN